MKQPQPIVDIMGKVIASMRGDDLDDPDFDPLAGGLVAPFYKYGHPLQISNELVQMAQDIAGRNLMYPLFALKLDTPEEISDDLVEYNLNLAILDYTLPADLTIDRYKNVIKPILYPLYVQFMETLPEFGFFWDNIAELPPHTKIDRPYWGTPDGDNRNSATIFNDPLDAIEIVNLRIKRNLFCTI